jgi:hypothetical protein
VSLLLLLGLLLQLLRHVRVVHHALLLRLQLWVHVRLLHILLLLLRLLA